MSDARGHAEEALRYNRTHANSPRVRAALVEALEALLASEPAKVSGSVSIVRSDDPPAKPLPTCGNCGSNFIEPASATDAVVEAAEEVAPQLEGFCVQAETDARPPGGQQAGMDRSWASRVPPSVLTELRWYAREFRRLLAALDARRRG